MPSWDKQGGPDMVIDFQKAWFCRRQKKLRYIITIDEKETPLYAGKELEEGTITIMITARTPEEADALRKQSSAMFRTVVMV